MHALEDDAPIVPSGLVEMGCRVEHGSSGSRQAEAERYDVARDRAAAAPYDARMPFLLLAFIVVPLVELAVIGQVSDWLGLPLTLVLLLLDSVIGAVLVKREGVRAWAAFRTALSDARWPGDEVAQGALVLVGGALLVTPGFVTDLAGLAMVIPPTRRILSRLLRARFTPVPVRVFRSATGGSAGPGRDAGRAGRGGHDRGPRRGPDRGPGSTRSHDDVVDVEVVSVERDTPDEGPAPSSGALGEPKG